MTDPGDSSDTESFDKEGNGDVDFNIEDFPKGPSSNNSDDTTECQNQDKSEKRETSEKAGKGDQEAFGPTSPSGCRLDRKYICIKYPGNVVDSAKAIETLGGVEAISTAVDTPNRRLELRFRSEDGYCKPACGDRHTVAGFLLRVRRKKCRMKRTTHSLDEEAKTIEEETNAPSNTVNVEDAARYSEVDEDNRVGPCNVQSVADLADQVRTCNLDERDDGFLRKVPDTETQDEMKEDVRASFNDAKYQDLSHDEDYELPKLKVLGRIDVEFKFTSLCDFQYLPMTPSEKDRSVLECIYDSIYPSGIPPYSWLKKKVPYFLPPAGFSRMNTAQQYVPKTEVDSLPENVIGKNKKRKAGFSNFVNFTTADVPCAPPSGIETAMRVKFLQNAHLEQVRNIFEERPVWSKNAIMYKTRFTSEQLKILLPSVAYYFITGPWRIMWVKLGYDPRKDTSARKYQTLDYRLKAMHGLGSSVKCKRNYADYTLPYKNAPVSKSKAMGMFARLGEEQSQKRERELQENVYVYREGMLPPSRQMFYQYCDILVDEIQEMLSKLPDPLPGTKCHEKMGWLPVGFDEQCREIINRQVRAVLRKKMNIPLDHPTSLPRKRRYTSLLRRNMFRCKKPRKNREEANADTVEKKPEDGRPSTSGGDKVD